MSKNTKITAITIMAVTLLSGAAGGLAVYSHDIGLTSEVTACNIIPSENTAKAAGYNSEVISTLQKQVATVKPARWHSGFKWNNGRRLNGHQYCRNYRNNNRDTQNKQSDWHYRNDSTYGSIKI